MDLYAVIGHPIAHSKSPMIHSMFAQQTGDDIEYTAIQAPISKFTETATQFFEHGGKGLNVTVPFKEEAWQLSADRSEQAQLAGAVNTLYLNESRICGDNTDGSGLVRDLTINHRLQLSGQRILLLGAGGAARGILLPLLQQQPEALVIANRTSERAEQLAELFADFGNISASPCEALNSPFDLIINGTSTSLQGTIPAIADSVIASHTVCYDMMYSSEATSFCRWARANNAERCIDGLGMLVEQAAESYSLWRGVRPDTQKVLEMLRHND